MSFTRFRPLVVAVALAVIPSAAGTAQAQLFRNIGNRCNTCAPAQQVAFAPIQQAAYNPCSVCNQQQVVYRSVPVTQYQQVTQTVRKPIVETAYEDRQITEYRTVYENKTAQIPTVSYQNVTEYQTVTRDMGRWVSYQQPTNKVTPCQYDNSQGLLGMFNRSRYRMRTAFMPKTVTRRQYCPRTVAMQVPRTRQVAIRGTKTINYQVARLEPHTVTKQVAVRRIRYEDKQVVAMVPTTTYRSVPIGTQTAFGFVPYTEGSSTVTAQAVPDPNFTKSAKAPTEVPKRTAKKPEVAPKKIDTSKKPGGFNPFGMNNGSASEPILSASFEQTTHFNPSPASSAKPIVSSVTQGNGWRARTTLSETSLPSSGSAPADPSLHVVNTTN